MTALIIGLILSFIAIGILYYLNNQLKKAIEKNNKALLALQHEFTSILGRNIKNDFRLIKRDYFKVRRVIKSCQCEEHLAATNRLITLFYMKHGNQFLLKKLEKRFWFKKRLILKK